MTSQYSLLICEDEFELAIELAEYLTTAGWLVRAVLSGDEAETFLREGPRTDCLLTDLRIADYDGKDLIAFARRLPIDQKPKVIGVITGHLDDFRFSESDIKTDAFFTKPIDPEVVSDELFAKVLSAKAT